MSSRNFREMIEQNWADGKFVCVGLDSQFERLPQSLKDLGGQGMLRFNCQIIDQTADLICAYKPNIAFYEELGSVGLNVLRDTIRYIHSAAPHVPVILDAKRADIGNTNHGYARAAFEHLKADALTVNPYLGEEALQTFLQYTDKGIIVLCRTSNPGAGEFQDLYTLTRDPRVRPEGMSAEEWLAVLCEDTYQLYERVALNVAEKWNRAGNCLLVVGATYPLEAQRVRRLVGDLAFLVPALGDQGGDAEATIMATKDSRGWGMIINSSRGIIFSPNPRQATETLHNLINQFREG